MSVPIQCVFRRPCWLDVGQPPFPWLAARGACPSLTQRCSLWARLSLRTYCVSSHSPVNKRATRTRQTPTSGADLGEANGFSRQTSIASIVETGNKRKNNIQQLTTTCGQQTKIGRELRNTYCATPSRRQQSAACTPHQVHLSGALRLWLHRTEDIARSATCPEAPFGCDSACGLRASQRFERLASSSATAARSRLAGPLSALLGHLLPPPPSFSSPPASLLACPRGQPAVERVGLGTPRLAP